jgi:hypothetical protein
VLPESLVQSVPQTVAVLRIVAERAVTARLMLAGLAAFVSQRPRCRDPRPIHANVALELNRVALSLAYYCDERTLPVRHLTSAHLMHSTRSRNARLRHTVVCRLRPSNLLALRDDGQTL